MKTLSLATLLVTSFPAALAGQEAISPFPLGVTVAVDAVSTYPFRGVDVTDATSLQPWATVSMGSTGLSFTAWGSWAVEDRGALLPYSASLTRGDADEVDLTAALTRAAGPVALSAGYVAYVYPAQDYTTQEVYAGVGLPLIPLAPTLTAFYDFDGTDDPAREPDTVEGAYVLLSGSQRIPVGIPLDASASLGWTDQNALRPDPGLNDVAVSVGTALALGPVSVTPAVGYAHLFEGSAYYGTEAHHTFWVRVQVKAAR